MGLLEAVFGGADGTDDADDGSQQYAVLMNAGPDRFAAAGNGFKYALELDGAGNDVELFLDGEATKWPAEFAEDPDRPFGYHWERLRNRGLIAGACGYCANAFDSARACEANGVKLLSDSTEHAPSVAQLVEEDYEIITVG